MRKLVLFAATLLVPLSAQALTVKSALPGAELRGDSAYRFVGSPLNKARLFTKSGARLDWNNNFGPELRKMRNLTEADCVRRSDRFVAVRKGQDQNGFWYNGKPVCTLGHPQIKTRAVAIFLGENTRSKSSTRHLRGE